MTKKREICLSKRKVKKRNVIDTRLFDSIWFKSVSVSFVHPIFSMQKTASFVNSNQQWNETTFLNFYFTFILIGRRRTPYRMFLCWLCVWVSVLATMSAKVFFCRADMFFWCFVGQYVLMKSNQQSFGIQMVVYCVCSPILIFFFFSKPNLCCAVWFVLYISFIVFI